jgi:Ser/Thr protein kinase RdoA (MazF antagonist)
MKNLINLNIPYSLEYVIKKLNKKIRKIKRFSSGIINETYLVTFFDQSEIVVRIYNKERKVKEVAREIAIMEQLRKKGISIPEIYTVNNKKYLYFKDENKKNRIAVCMEFINGTELQPNDHSIIPVCATTQSKMHSILTKKNIPLKEKQRSILKIKKWMNKEVALAINNKNIKKEIKNQILKKYKSILCDWKINQKSLLEIPFGVVHLDYDSSNILIKNGKISGIIDFDDITDSPLLVDLGFSLWWWLFFNFEKSNLKVGKEYVKSYSKNRKLTEKEKDLLSFVIRVRNMILLCLLFINYAPKIQNKKIKNALILDTILINNHLI